MDEVEKEIKKEEEVVVDTTTLTIAIRKIHVVNHARRLQSCRRFILLVSAMPRLL